MVYHNTVLYIFFYLKECYRYFKNPISHHCFNRQLGHYDIYKGQNEKYLQNPDLNPDQIMMV